MNTLIMFKLPIKGADRYKGLNLLEIKLWGAFFYL